MLEPCQGVALVGSRRPFCQRSATGEGRESVGCQTQTAALDGERNLPSPFRADGEILNKM